MSKTKVAFKKVENGNDKFSQMVKDVVFNASDDDNNLYFQVPLESNYGDLFTNILVSVSNVLGQEGFSVTELCEKDEYNDFTMTQYYSKNTVEIFYVVKQDSSFVVTEASYVFKGDKNEIINYRSSIINVIEKIIEETVFNNYQ